MDRTPPYEQVAEHYRDAIRAGRLTVGDELPSVRRIAGQWNIATATAQRALDLLRSEGWIESRPGRPSVVAPR
ncbi:MAG: GntR family transcriptional regulator [Actinomycetota bacterium]|nr:GntR family transcriptional regulator [Actinomycetota bacterium]